jgi:hypothetical protein
LIAVENVAPAGLDGDLRDRALWMLDELVLSERAGHLSRAAG